MKKWTRFLGLATALLLMATLFAGCASTGGASAEEGYIVLTEDLGAEEYGVGFRNEDIALGLEVQKQLDAMISDGKAAEISEKWFGADILLKDQAFKEESEAAADDKSLENIKAKGTLVLGLDDSFPPMGYRDDANNIVGFDIDLATEVAKRMGVELVLQPIDWDAKELELSTGKIDCIWNGMTITDERIASMYFTKAYVNNRQVIIVPADSTIKTKADLEGKIIGLQKGSSSLDALNKDAIAQKVKQVSEYADNVTAFLDLKAGRVDAFVVDEVVGRYIMEQNS